MLSSSLPPGYYELRITPDNIITPEAVVHLYESNLPSPSPPALVLTSAAFIAELHVLQLIPASAGIPTHRLKWLFESMIGAVQVVYSDRIEYTVGLMAQTIEDLAAETGQWDEGEATLRVELYLYRTGCADLTRRLDIVKRRNRLLEDENAGLRARMAQMERAWGASNGATKAAEVGLSGTMPGKQANGIVQDAEVGGVAGHAMNHGREDLVGVLGGDVGGGPFDEGR
jgi:hypothetical protein